MARSTNSTRDDYRLRATKRYQYLSQKRDKIHTSHLQKQRKQDESYPMVAQLRINGRLSRQHRQVKQYEKRRDNTRAMHIMRDPQVIQSGIERLHKISQSLFRHQRGLIELSDANYRSLLDNARGVRYYYTLLLISAQDHYDKRCEICQQTDDHFIQFASQYFQHQQLFWNQTLTATTIDEIPIGFNPYQYIIDEGSSIPQSSLEFFKDIEMIQFPLVFARIHIDTAHDLFQINEINYAPYIIVIPPTIVPSLDPPETNLPLTFIKDIPTAQQFIPFIRGADLESFLQTIPPYKEYKAAIQQFPLLTSSVDHPLMNYQLFIYFWIGIIIFSLIVFYTVKYLHSIQNIFHQGRIVIALTCTIAVSYHLSGPKQVYGFLPNHIDMYNISIADMFSHKWPPSPNRDPWGAETIVFACLLFLFGSLCIFLIEIALWRCEPSPTSSLWRRFWRFFQCNTSERSSSYIEVKQPVNINNHSPPSNSHHNTELSSSSSAPPLPSSYISAASSSNIHPSDHRSFLPTIATVQSCMWTTLIGLVVPLFCLVCLFFLFLLATKMFSTHHNWYIDSTSHMTLLHEWSRRFIQTWLPWNFVTVWLDFIVQL